MPRLSRFLFIAMASTFAVCSGGVIGGVLYALYSTYFKHRDLEAILNSAHLYNTVVGAIGVLGMLLFFAFLFSLISHKNKGNPN